MKHTCCSERLGRAYDAAFDPRRPGTLTDAFVPLVARDPFVTATQKVRRDEIYEADCLSDETYPHEAIIVTLAQVDKFFGLLSRLFNLLLSLFMLQLEHANAVSQ